MCRLHDTLTNVHLAKVERAAEAAYVEAYECKQAAGPRYSFWFATSAPGALLFSVNHPGFG